MLKRASLQPARVHSKHTASLTLPLSIYLSAYLPGRVSDLSTFLSVIPVYQTTCLYPYIYIWHTNTYDRREDWQTNTASHKKPQQHQLFNQLWAFPPQTNLPTIKRLVLSKTSRIHRALPAHPTTLTATTAAGRKTAGEEEWRDEQKVKGKKSEWMEVNKRGKTETKT